MIHAFHLLEPTQLHNNVRSSLRIEAGSNRAETRVVLNTKREASKCERDRALLQTRCSGARATCGAGRAGRPPRSACARRAAACPPPAASCWRSPRGTGRRYARRRSPAGTRARPASSVRPSLHFLLKLFVSLEDGEESMRKIRPERAAEAGVQDETVGVPLFVRPVRAGGTYEQTLVRQSRTPLQFFIDSVCVRYLCFTRISVFDVRTQVCKGCPQAAKLLHAHLQHARAAAAGLPPPPPLAHDAPQPSTSAQGRSHESLQSFSSMAMPYLVFVDEIDPKVIIKEIVLVKRLRSPILDRERECAIALALATGGGPARACALWPDRSL
ncbi:hypothetical protein EVAR_39379_1 [Eumeta japonica]|uniref:Uncharacterized protein n=1 Tax=Eumeta variegata TaxID=151549 RepID=A0A4C1Z800_EUMVA|nr:hypothetical protein EVAR_39379_1 [Eumeta japonica]